MHKKRKLIIRNKSLNQDKKKTTWEGMKKMLNYCKKFEHISDER